MENELESEKYTKVIYKFDPDLVENMQNMDSDALKARILSSEANLLENDRKMNLDRDLKTATARVKELKGPYDDARKFQSAIIKYAAILLEYTGDAAEGD